MNKTIMNGFWFFGLKDKKVGKSNIVMENTTFSPNVVFSLLLDSFTIRNGYNNLFSSRRETGAKLLISIKMMKLLMNSMYIDGVLVSISVFLNLFINSA